MLPWEHSHADQEETQNIGSRKKIYKEQKTEATEVQSL